MPVSKRRASKALDLSEVDVDEIRKQIKKNLSSFGTECLMKSLLPQKEKKTYIKTDGIQLDSRPLDRQHMNFGNSNVTQIKSPPDYVRIQGCLANCKTTTMKVNSSILSDPTVVLKGLA